MDTHAIELIPQEKEPIITYYPNVFFELPLMLFVAIIVVMVVGTVRFFSSITAQAQGEAK